MRTLINILATIVGIIALCLMLAFTGQAIQILLFWGILTLWAKFFLYAPKQAIVVTTCLILLNVTANVAEHKFKQSAQQNENLYSIMQAIDVLDLIHGGCSGGFDNYLLYEYAVAHKKMREDKDWRRFLSWPRSFMFDLTDPPEKYRYPPQFDTT